MPRQTLTLLLVALIAAPGLADLCATCRDKAFIASIGECSQCRAETSSGAFALCKACSNRLSQCEHCRKPLTGTTRPATRPVTAK